MAFTGPGIPVIQLARGSYLFEKGVCFREKGVHLFAIPIVDIRLLDSVNGASHVAR